MPYAEEGSEKKKKKFWEFFRRRRKTTDTSSDDEDDAKKRGFLGRKKKPDRGSKDVTNSFLINPPPPVIRTDLKTSAESVRSTNSSEVSGRRRIKAKVEASRELLGHESSSDEGSSYTSYASSMHSGGSFPKRSRAARTERHNRRISRDMDGKVNKWSANIVYTESKDYDTKFRAKARSATPSPAQSPKAQRTTVTRQKTSINKSTSTDSLNCKKAPPTPPLRKENARPQSLAISTDTPKYYPPVYTAPTHIINSRLRLAGQKSMSEQQIGRRLEHSSSLSSVSPRPTSPRSLQVPRVDSASSIGSESFGGKKDEIRPLSIVAEKSEVSDIECRRPPHPPLTPERHAYSVDRSDRLTTPDRLSDRIPVTPERRPDRFTDRLPTPDRLTERRPATPERRSDRFPSLPERLPTPDRLPEIVPVTPERFADKPSERLPTPDRMSDRIPVTPERRPERFHERLPTPDRLPERIPVTPERRKERYASLPERITPDRLPERIPVTPERRPERYADRMPERLPTPDRLPERIPVTPERRPDRFNDRMSDILPTPDRMPERIPLTPERRPDRLPLNHDIMSDRIPVTPERRRDRFADRKSERLPTPDRIPERIPVTPERRSDRLAFSQDRMPDRIPVTPERRPRTPDRRPLTPERRPLTPERRPSRQSSLPVDMMESRKHANNLEEALHELEAIYKKLSYDDNSSYDASCNGEILPTDDMAYRRLNKREPSIQDVREIMGQAGSYLLVSPALSPPPIICHSPPEGEPDITYDDVVYRSVNHTNNTLKIHDPQPPFGIPLGPITPAPNTDYLHVRPRLVPSGSSPDLVMDDLAFRNLRKDHHTSSSKKKAMRSMSANLSGVINRNYINNNYLNVLNNNLLEERSHSYNDIPEEMRLAQRVLDMRRNKRSRKEELMIPLPGQMRRQLSDCRPLNEPETEYALLEQLAAETRAASDQIDRELRQLNGPPVFTRSMTDLLQEMTHNLNYDYGCRTCSKEPYHNYRYQQQRFLKPPTTRPGAIGPPRPRNPFKEEQPRGGRRRDFKRQSPVNVESVDDDVFFEAFDNNRNSGVGTSSSSSREAEDACRNIRDAASGLSRLEKEQGVA